MWYVLDSGAQIAAHRMDTMDVAKLWQSSSNGSFPRTTRAALVAILYRKGNHTAPLNATSLKR